MKTRIIIIALAMLTVASAASAQEAIKKQFERIDNMKGITHVSESKSWTTDSTGLMTGSRVIILRAGEQYFGDLDKLREAFDNDGSWASMTYSYIADHFTDGENGAPRRRFSVHRDGADPIIVGDMKNSTYLIANFDDKEHPGYRRCYAAEWTETDDPDPRPLQLTYVYGRKPQPQTTISRTIRYSGRADWPELERRLEELKLIPDTLLKDETFHLDLGQRLSELRDSLRSAGVYKFDFTMPGDGQPQDIPMTDGDCGCGKAYLTLSLYFYLTEVLKFPDVRVVGVDRRGDVIAAAKKMAEQLDVAEKVVFVESDLSEFDAEGYGPVSMVVSLHACDTATDEALAKGVEWKTRYILSAPCCQHELQKTIGTGGGKSRAEGDFAGLLRQSILRERLCDILTDSFRAQILRILGYRTQVVEFVSPDATARNIMLKCEYGVKPGQSGPIGEYLALRDAWQVTPWLETRLSEKLGKHLERHS